MPEKQLKEDLEQLRREIGELDVNDEAARERLAALAEEIEARIASNTGEGLVENVQDAIREYEVEHPRATGVLNQILMTLSNMGI